MDPITGKAVTTKEGYTEVEKWVRVEMAGQRALFHLVLTSDMWLVKSAREYVKKKFMV